MWFNFGQLCFLAYMFWFSHASDNEKCKNQWFNPLFFPTFVQKAKRV